MVVLILRAMIPPMIDLFLKGCHRRNTPISNKSSVRHGATASGRKTNISFGMKSFQGVCRLWRACFLPRHYRRPMAFLETVCNITHPSIVTNFHVLVRILFSSMDHNEIGALIRFGFRPSLGGTKTNGPSFKGCCETCSLQQRAQLIFKNGEF